MNFSSRPAFYLCRLLLFIKRRVDCVEVFAVKVVLSNSQGVGKTVNIEVLDNFDRGIKAIETVEDCEKVKECYQLAYKNFNDVLGKIGLEVIKAEGEEFNPNLHEAVMQTPTDEKPENTIIAELQKGYKLGDKVLRASLVNVATAP